MKSRLTYKKSGVDIGEAEIFKKKISECVRSSFIPGVLKGIGGFGSLFELPASKFKKPVLVSSTDGVGTKLKIAALAKKHDTIGIDLVAMNVNDILCVGAQPLFFLDYIACGKLNRKVLIDVVKGINDGCVEAGCALVGGETAQMPDMYDGDEYDVAGFCLGAVEKEEIIDGGAIAPGDIIIGLESSGIHSNGYSLVRKVFSDKELKSRAAELLKPTRIYVKPVLGLLKEPGLKKAIKGIAHITGGAFYDKIARILPVSVGAKIDKGGWEVPDIFRLIQRKGRVAEKEMYHTLNMGIGMVIIVKKDSPDAIMRKLSDSGLSSFIIGEITGGKKDVAVV